MGIAGLARRLDSHATRYAPETLKGYNAIIDGPSLAYHAHKLALAAVGSQSHIPSYADILVQALRWLKALENVCIKVSAIVFDGALPDTKKNERVSRLEQNNQRVRNLRVNYPTAACPIPTQLGSASYSLLAPALLEVLIESEYASVTCSVPGEADDWCARYAIDSDRSMVFSNDTDLLLYEYLEDGIVAFFKDVELWPEPKFRGYSPFKIRQSLDLTSLVPLAYSVTQNPLKTFNDLLEDARKVDTESNDYYDFSLRYTTENICGSQGSSIPQFFDARVSEFIYQARGHRSVFVIFLPLLIEDPNQSSAYNIGRGIRLLAYSLPALNQQTTEWQGAQEKVVKAQEYVRKAQTITVHDVRLYTPKETCDAAASLARDVGALLQWTVERQVPQQFIWPLIATNLVLQELHSAPKISLLLRIFNAEFDNTWDFIHLTARIQAALYSLRFLKQCIAVWMSINQGHSEEPRQHIDSLQRDLWSMPSIQDLFIVPGQAKKMHGHQELLQELIGDIFISTNIEAPNEQKSNKKRKKQKREAARKERREHVISTQQSNNLFNLLDTE